MKGNVTHTIFFIYDVRDHALKFSLKAEVVCNDAGVYTVSNIRPESSDNDGVLLPPIQLKKENGGWIFLDNGQESILSNTIGRAIEDSLIGENHTHRHSPKQ
ncbi:MAG TPA: hypothetical protein VKQ52_07930 [Puia sp.]|nr:hypothetical protein [Puia sp.]